jgi:sec-independent protein translocase protein TatA
MNMPIMPLPANILSPMDILVVIVIAILVFGPSKLSGIGKGFGEGIRNFKSAVNDGSKPETKPDQEKK